MYYVMPGSQAGSLFRAGGNCYPGVTLRNVMFTKRLEAMRMHMRIVLSAVLLLVWFPGLARRA